MPTEMERARRLVAEADCIVVLTGAGISAESGVPTFRGAGGLWKSHRPEELATPEAFARDPQTVWEWYAWRRGLIADCDPNHGHLALARLALGGTPPTIVPQTVDGLHTRAAPEAARGPRRERSRQVFELRSTHAGHDLGRYQQPRGASALLDM